MVGEGRHFCRGLGIHTFRVPRQLRAPRGRVKAQVLDPNGHHVLGRWMSDCPSSCLPCHLVYTLLSRLCPPPPPHIVRVGGGTSHDRLWTSNINKSGYIFHKHLYVCITSRTRLVEGWGRRPAYEATGSQYTLKYSAIPATGYGQLAISVNIYNILYITYYKTL